MSRVAAWQKKKSAHWLATREVLSNTTLYLVNRLGPTVFSVRDDALSTYKVILGNPHSCTCGALATDELCVHQLYCLIKVLRIHEEHPLVYQLGITDPEVESVLSGQCGPPTGLDRSQNAGSGNVIENRSAAARARRKARQKADEDPNSPTRNSEFVDRQVLGEAGAGDEDEDVCPICQDGMNMNQALTWCRKGCGNNIHAKCMQTFAQYKISSNAQVECPLCRSEWNIALLKDDVRGKATLKNSCAPVYCTQCTMPVRAGPFHRCIECSQRRALAFMREVRRFNQSGGGIAPTESTQGGGFGGASIGTIGRSANTVAAASAIFTDVAQFREAEVQRAAAATERAESRASSAVTGKKCADFCERCFTHALGKEHAVHHFVSSDAGTNADDDVEWVVVKNPLQTDHNASVLLYEAAGQSNTANSRLGSADNGLRPELAALQDREITMDDYNMLLELDEVAQSASVAEHLAAALPKAGAVSRGDDNNETSHSPMRAAAAAAAAKSGKLCWCKVSAEVAAGMNISGIASAKLKTLPCGHIAHDRCIHAALDQAKNIEAVPYASFRCRHDGCRALLFPSLQRSRKKTKKADGSGGKRVGTSSSASVASAMTEDSVFGQGTLSVSGFSQPLIGNFGVARPEGLGVLVASSRGTALVPVSVTATTTTTTSPQTHVSRATAATMTQTQPYAAAAAAVTQELPQMSDMEWDVAISPDHMDSTASIASMASFGGLSSASIAGERSVGGHVSGGAVRKGRPKGKYDARVATPPKPASNTFADIYHPANPMRGRQRFHQSPLAPVGGINTRTIPRSAPRPISQQDMNNMQDALTVRPASTRVVITPITMNNMQSSLSGTMPESVLSGTSAGAGAGGGGGNAGNSSMSLTISGGSAASHHPKQLTRLIRSSHSGNSGAGRATGLGTHTAASFGMGAGIAGSANKTKGKLAKSCLGRGGNTRANGNPNQPSGGSHRVLSFVDTHAPALLPSLSATQLHFKGRSAPLNEHLQPSGSSRTLQQDEREQHLRLGAGLGMGVLGGMGWTQGHRAEETEG